MYKVYLSGPISGLDFDEADDWRKAVSDRLSHNIIPLNPLRCKEWLRGRGKIIANSAYEHWMGTDEFIGTRDHWDTFRSDLIFCNLLGAKSVSIGTMIEIGIAHHARVPIILVMEPSGNVHEHCMLRNYTTIRFDNINYAIDATNAMLSV